MYILQKIVANIFKKFFKNFAKTFRVKQVEFPDDGFTMDLPKQMALSTIALQALYINYDFCSSHCSTFAYKPPKKTVVPEIIEVQNL